VKYHAPIPTSAINAMTGDRNNGFFHVFSFHDCSITDDVHCLNAVVHEIGSDDTLIMIVRYHPPALILFNLDDGMIAY